MAGDSPQAPIQSGDLNRSGCFRCNSTSIEPLLALDREGIPPAKPGHNIGYNHRVVVLCRDCGAGFLEVRNHDCFDWEEVWDQDDWYLIDPRDMEVLRAALEPCPNPVIATCQCRVHLSLRNSSQPGNLPKPPQDDPLRLRQVFIGIRKGDPVFLPRASDTRKR